MQTSLEKKEKTSDHINRLSAPTLLASSEGDRQRSWAEGQRRAFHPSLFVSSFCSCHGLVFLVQPKGQQGSAGDLLNLESHTWNITDGVTLTTETGNEHFVVLIDEGESTVTGDVRSNSLVVLFELHSDALTNGGVGLLGFDSNLLNNNASGLRRASEGLLSARDRVGLGV